MVRHRLKSTCTCGWRRGAWRCGAAERCSPCEEDIFGLNCRHFRAPPMKLSMEDCPSPLVFQRDRRRGQTEPCFWVRVRSRLHVCDSTPRTVTRASAHRAMLWPGEPPVLPSDLIHKRMNCFLRSVVGCL